MAKCVLCGFEEAFESDQILYGMFVCKWCFEELGCQEVNRLIHKIAMEKWERKKQK